MKLFKKKKEDNKIYHFKYKIIWNNGGETTGSIINSKLPPETIFLNNKFIYFNKGVCTYFNEKEIRQIEIYDLEEVK